MNKKGSTLIELIISIALISVILVFMIRLLVDINNRESNNDYAKDNQVIRAEIIRAIETEIKSKRLTNVTITEESPEQSKVTFEFDGDTDTKTSSTILVKSDNLIFNPAEGDSRSWTLKEGTFDFKNIYSDFTTDSTDKLQMLYLNIEIHTQNNNNTSFNIDLKTKNNILDDITISYLKKK